MSYEEQEKNCPIQAKVDNFFRWIAQYQSTLILILAGVAFFFGYWGFNILEGEGILNSSSLYRTFQLFVIESGLVENPPVQLEFARILAPLVAAYAIILLFVKVFWENLQVFMLKIPKKIFRFRIKKPHIIICGLGYLGPYYVQKFRNRGYLPVVIEKDADNPIIHSFGPFNPHIIIGDATDQKILNEANIKKSSGVIAATGDDTTNIKIMMAANDLLWNSYTKNEDTSQINNTSRSPAFLLMHIENRWLSPALPKNETNVVPFNMYEIAADALVSWIWKDTCMESIHKNPHILLVGIGTLGEAFCRKMTEKWFSFLEDVGETDKTLLMTFMDYKEVDDKKKRIDSWIEKVYPNFTKSVNIIAENVKIPSFQFEKGDYLLAGNQNTVTSIVICLADETLAMTSALKFDMMFEAKQMPKNIPVFVRITREDGLKTFIEELNNKNRYGDIKPFSIVEYGAYDKRALNEDFPPNKCRLSRICQEKGCERK